jgi:hypothetical protein
MAKKTKQKEVEIISVTHALTVRQPYAEMIRRGDKEAEYRSWPLPEKHRNKWIAIHAAAKPYGEEEIDGKLDPEYLPINKLPRSVIVAFVKFIDCEQLDDGGYAWIIGEWIELEYKEKFKGGLGIWKLPEPLEVESDPNDVKLIEA